MAKTLLPPVWTSIGGLHKTRGRTGVGLGAGEGVGLGEGEGVVLAPPPRPPTTGEELPLELIAVLLFGWGFPVAGANEVVGGGVTALLPDGLLLAAVTELLVVADLTDGEL